MYRPKRILIISEAHLIKTFVQATAIKLKEETGAQFDCFILKPISQKEKMELATAFDNIFINEYPKKIIGKLPKIRTVQSIYGLRRVAKRLPDYDIAHMFFHYYIFALFTPIIRKKAKHFFLSFLGGDFDHISNLKHWFNNRTIKLLDVVFAENCGTLKNIATRYNLYNREKKTDVLKILMNNFVSFDTFLKNNTNESAKEIWGWNKKVIACGYSAGSIMQHEAMIDALDQISEKLSDYKIIFPMTYGYRGEETRVIVNKKLKATKLDSLILTEFLSVEQIQSLRLAADLFINIPSRDQLASSLMEHLAAGSVVITGKWLPYDNLIEMGLYYILIESPQDLPAALSDVLDNLEDYKMKCRVNREIILNWVSWDSIKLNWYKYYELEQRV
jgi:glycosyltransferase involved in cell wall biosynthesis